MYATSINDLEILMKQTIQYRDINVLEHGYMVNKAYKVLIKELESGNHIESNLYNSIKSNILDDEIINRYQIYHDCGKPFCTSESGSFHNHAMHSFNQWNILFPDDKTVSDLMMLDMGFHTLRGDEIIELWNNQLAPTLYFTAWAELEANASMFGGHDSDSYKIKRKRLIQAGKKYKG